VAALVGALVAAVSAAVPEVVAERLLVREAGLVEASVCELNVVLRETDTPVPIEAGVVTEVIVEFIDADVRLRDEVAE
jgi:ABC-type Co2+ transport system permease subunit